MKDVKPTDLKEIEIPDELIEKTYTIFMDSLQLHREHREEFLKSRFAINKYTDEEIRRFNVNERKLENYEAENAWWYYFFQAAGSSGYDAEYADHLRIDGVLPEVASEIAKI